MAVGTMDTLIGSVGDDRYVFNNEAVGGGALGFDTVNEATGQGTDMLDFFSHMNRAVKVDLGTTAQQSSMNSCILKFSDAAGIENVEGTYYNDVLRGNSLNNYFYGSDGNDTLYGMAGHDTLDGCFTTTHCTAATATTPCTAATATTDCTATAGHVLFGQNGDDGLYGGTGSDVL